MKNLDIMIITSLLMFISQVSFGQKSKDSVLEISADTIDGIYIPADLEDCFVQIDTFLNDSLKTEIMKTSEEVFLAQSHFGLGIWMRNNWGLWRGSRLSRFFNEQGVYHPDDMSGMILSSYHRRLLGKEINLDQQIARNRLYHMVSEEPKKRDYPKGVKKIEIRTKRLYNFSKNELPGMVHIQTNAKGD